MIETATNNDLQVVFGTGPVSAAMADELTNCGGRVRIVNRGGRANAPGVSPGR